MMTVDVETTEQGQPSVIHLYNENGERQAFNVMAAYLCEPIKESYRGYREIKLLAIDIKSEYGSII
jgi:hypothetical protein